LAPVRLDLVSPPLGFGETQYADLAAWSGGADDPRFQHFLGVVQAIVRSEPIPMAPRPTHFEAPGIKLQGVTMENVNIHVGGAHGGPNSISVGGGAEDNTAEEDQPPSSIPPSRRPQFSLSMFFTRAIGVILPLAALIIFILQMGHVACVAGNAPLAFCELLMSITGRK